jgi:hypothetical protein
LVSEFEERREIEEFWKRGVDGNSGVVERMSHYEVENIARLQLLYV